MFTDKKEIMTNMLHEIGQMKDLYKSEPSSFYKRIEKKNGKGFTYFYTESEYDKYINFRSKGNN